MHHSSVARAAPALALATAACFAAIVALPSCAASAREPVDPAVAGLREWSLGPPTLRVGSAAVTDSIALTQVQQVVPLPDESAFVRDSRIRSVLHFSQDGQLLARIGREGSGPSEFFAISNIGLRGDTLWASDSRNRRALLFGLDGTLLGTQPLLTMRTSPRTGFIISRNFLSRESFVRGTGIENPPPDAPIPPPKGGVAALAIMDTAGIPVDTLAVITTGQSTLLLDVPPNLHFPGPNYFLDTPLWVVADDGSSVVLVMTPVQSRRYDIVSTEGTPAGFITIAPSARVLAATAQAVWVVETDADDVPTILRYPLQKPTR